MSFKDKKQESKEGPKNVNPFENAFLGSEILIQTSKGNVITNILLDVTSLWHLLEEHEQDLANYAGFTSQDGKLFLRIKGIPLRNPDEKKSHFLVLDYYKKQ